MEVVNIRIKAVGVGKKIKLKKKPQDDPNPERAFLKKQTYHYNGKSHKASVFNRALLSPGNKLNGPALIADAESTTFLPPSYALKVDGFLNLIIQRINTSDGCLDGKGHGSKMNRDMRTLSKGFSFPVEKSTGKILPFFDVGR